MKNVIITGSTGMVGGIVLQHCLQSPEIAKVTTINRRESGITHPKLQEIIHADFLDYTNIAQAFEDIDIAHFCIGAYTGAVPDDVFKTITVDFTITFADTLKARSPEATFCFLSGSGADPSEKSRVSFAKYKGMAENHLSKNFEQLYIFRPGYIYPVEKRKEPNLMYTLSRWLYPVLRLMGNKYSIQSTELGEALFKAGLTGAPKSVLENEDILRLLKQ